MGCKIMFFLQPIQLFKILYLNLLKKIYTLLIALIRRQSLYQRLAKRKHQAKQQCLPETIDLKAIYKRIAQHDNHGVNY